ncbi:MULTISPECIES: hypothetical protein [unclassified Streptomyces]|uniref:hypothetical protein n=1 Tax=unclassified Streptomyces TaxID=2593676 RepID=UPI003702E91D
MKIFTALSAGSGGFIAQLAGAPVAVVVCLLILALVAVVAPVVPTVVASLLAYRDRRDGRATVKSIAEMASELPAPERSAVLITLATTLAPAGAPPPPSVTSSPAATPFGEQRIPTQPGEDRTAA